MSDRPHRKLGWPTAAGLLVTLCGPAAIAAMSPLVLGDSTNVVALVSLQLAFCGLAVLVLLLVRFGERLPLSSIGLKRPSWSTAVTALLLFLVGFWLLPIVTDPMVKAWGQAGAD